MSVQTPNAAYKARMPMRQRVRDALSGIDRIRARTTQYIPLPDTQCNQNSQRYKDYLGRTYYVNTPLRTITTLCGLISNKEPEIELPTQMKYLRESADGPNTQLDQQIKDQQYEVLALGRGGVCAILKNTPADGVNAANQSAFIPTLRQYKEEQIINWRVKDGKLVMLVLREHDTVPSEDDEFKDEIVVSFRVFTMSDTEQVIQRIYTGKDKRAVVESSAYFQDEYGELLSPPGEWNIDKSELTEAKGKPLTEIPFSFIGSVNNDADCDTSPAINIVDLALTYYRLSADEQLNVHLTACGFVEIASDLDPEDWKKFNGSFDVDASFGTYFVGPQGHMKYVQALPAESVNTSMDRVMKNAVSIGAQIITDAVTDKTATEARINNASNTSQLVQIAKNISDAYTYCLKVIARVLGVSDDAYLSIPTEFFDNEISPDMIRALSEAVLKGNISINDFLNWQKRVGFLDEERTVEIVKGELDSAADEAALSGAVVVPRV